MLKTLREHSRSLLIYLLFGILIAVFVISFGPQAGPSTSGCMPGSSYAAKVGPQEVPDASWRFAWLVLGGGSGARAKQSRLREAVMDGLIERELFAQAAETAGFRISDEEVEGRIAEGEVYVLGNRLPGEMYFFQDGVFDYKRLENFTRQFAMPSVNHFVEEQRRELLALRMRESLTSAVRVSPEEVRQRYDQQNTKAWLHFVKFEPRKFARSLELAPDEIDAWLAAHEADVKAQYESDKSFYTARGDEVRIRHVFIEKATPPEPTPPPPAEVAPATQPAASAPAAPPAAAAPDTARPEAEAALERIQAGEDFAAVARDVSDDERSARRGGDVGWRPIAGLGFGPELAAAVAGLEKGATSGIVESARGFHIVKLEGRRSGDLSYDDVKRDIAEEKLREEKARALARAAADETLAKATAGTPLDQQFESADAEPAAPEATPVTAADPDRPKLVDSGEVRRNGAIVSGPSGDKFVGKSAALAKAIFEELEPGKLAPKVYEVEDGFVVLSLDKRETPVEEEFQKEKDLLAYYFTAEKAQRVVDSWAARRCLDARAKGDIVVNTMFVESNEVDPKTGKPLNSTYQPCASAAAPAAR